MHRHDSNLRRNQCSPKFPILGLCEGFQEMHRKINFQVCIPALDIALSAQVAVGRGNRAHTRSVAGHNVAFVVTYIHAMLGVDGHPPRGLKERLRVRLGVRRGVAADHRASGRKQGHGLRQWVGKALGLVGHHTPRHAALVQGADHLLNSVKREGTLRHAIFVIDKKLCLVALEFRVLRSHVKGQAQHTSGARTRHVPIVRQWERRQATVGAHFVGGRAQIGPKAPTRPV